MSRHIYFAFLCSTHCSTVFWTWLCLLFSSLIRQGIWWGYHQPWSWRGLGLLSVVYSQRWCWRMLPHDHLGWGVLGLGEVSQICQFLLTPFSYPLGLSCPTILQSLFPILLSVLGHLPSACRTWWVRPLLDEVLEHKNVGCPLGNGFFQMAW